MSSRRKDAPVRSREPHGGPYHAGADGAAAGPSLPWAELFAATPLALSINDARAERILYATPAYAEMHGYAADEVAGMRVADTYADGEQPVLAALKARSTTERALTFRARHRRRDGSTFPARVDVRAVSDAAGVVQYYVVTVEDLTAAEAAAEARARLAAIVASSEDAIVGVALDGTVTTWNAAAERLLGHAAAEIVGRSLLTIVPADRRDEEPALLARVAAGERIAPYETVRVHRDGGARHVSLSISPVRDDAGAVIGAAKILRDVTAQRQREAAERFLAEASARLARSLDVAATLETLGALAVETLADGCRVTLLDEAAAARGAYPFAHVAVASRDPARAALAEEIQRRFPLPADAPAGFARVIRTGESEVVPPEALDPAMLPALAPDPEHRALLERLDVRAALVVPLCAQGRTLGAMTLVRHGPGPRPPFTARERDVAEELGRRAGLALENARLFAAERDARADAERAKARLEDVLDSIVESFYEFDADWRVVRLNRAARERMRPLGADPDVVVGRTIWDVFPALRGSELERVYRTVMRTRRPARFTTRNPVTGGWLDVQVVPTREGVAAYAHDVTERVLADRDRDLLVRTGEGVAASLEPDATLDAIVRAPLGGFADYAIVDLLEEGGVIRRARGAHADPARMPLLARVLAAAPRLGSADFVAEVIRTGVPMLAPETTPEMPRGVSPDPDWLEAVRALGARSHVCVPLVARDTVLGALLLVRTAAGRPFEPSDLPVAEEIARRAALALDRARLFDAERRARAEAEQANRAKGDFLANMSHELRTPLNAIGGHVELVELGLHGPITDAQREALGRVQRAQRHLLGLINDVLNYAKLEAGRVEYFLAEVDLAAAVRAAASLVEPQRLAKGLLWAVRADATPCRVQADAEKLEQVLLNLMSNAVKFTPDGGRVEVVVRAARGPSGLAAVEVRDTGIGIPADRLAAIFEPFVQVNASRARGHEGTGLGLTISRDLARGMGGDLTVESTPDVGSTFTLTLPAG